MKNSILMLPIALLMSATFAGCSLFPSTTSRPAVTIPARPVPSAPAPSQSTSSPATTSTYQDLNTPEKIAEFEAACKAAHGNWNACASPCRNQPNAQVCIQSCMMVCECGGFAGFGCPAGYECADYVPGPNVPDAMGICKPTTQGNAGVYKEFTDDKQVYVSVVVMAPFTDGRVDVGNPFTFYGTTTASAVFENQFSWRVKDATGKIVANGQAMTDSPDMGQPGGFKITAIFDAMPTGVNGMLDLFNNSPKDGSEQLFVSVPLRFTGLKTSEISIFLVNQNLSKDQNDCTEVQPVKRTVVATQPIQIAAMHALLQGPNQKEKNAGYVTSLPEGVHQPAFTWGDYTNVIDFDETLTTGMAGSCRVQSAQAQLEKTMGDACIARHCLISVNGSEEQALQP